VTTGSAWQQLTAIGLLALAVGSCAHSVPARSGSATGPSASSLHELRTPEEGAHEPRIPDWNKPFAGNGIVASSASEAAALIKAFPVYGPAGLGQADIISVTRDNPPEAVIFVYANSPYGMVWVAESTLDIPDEETRLASYQANVANNGKPDWYYTSEVVSVRQGLTGFLQTSDDPATFPTFIEWVDGAVQCEVLGPTLSKDRALAIANSLQGVAYRATPVKVVYESTASSIVLTI
jgi:hypothetical protein